MNLTSYQQQGIQWLLKEKYQWTAAEISQFLARFVTEKGESGSAHRSKTSSEIWQKDIQRFLDGEPIQYVIGWVDFFGCKIDLSLKPLIPRPETEYWVEKVLEGYEKAEIQTPLNILDLCCGSGCIGIATLKKFSEKSQGSKLSPAHVDLVDISKTALQQTQLNLDLNKILVTHYSIILSDLFQNLLGRTYDLILTNPPYVDPDGKLSPDLAYEPAEALFAAKNGLSLIEQIISELKNHLKPSGAAIIEFGEGQETAIQKICEENDFHHVEFGKDQYGTMRWVKIQ